MAKDLVQQIAQLNEQILKYLNKVLAPYGVNSGNYFYVMKIHDNPGIVQSDFNELVNLNPSSITRAVNHLIADGLVEKKAHPTDGRATTLYLTELGEKRVVKITSTVNKVNRDILAQNPDLYDLVTKAREQLDEFDQKR